MTTFSGQNFEHHYGVQNTDEELEIFYSFKGF